MKKFKLVLLGGILFYIGCYADQIEFVGNKDIASKTYSLKQYRHLPKDKKYHGKLVLTADNLTGLEFNRPVLRTYKLKAPTENILDVLKDKEFIKEYPFLVDEVLKVLVYNKHQMIVISSYAGELDFATERSEDKYLLEIDKNVVYVFHLESFEEMIEK